MPALSWRVLYIMLWNTPRRSLRSHESYLCGIESEKCLSVPRLRYQPQNLYAQFRRTLTAVDIGQTFNLADELD